MGTTGQAGEERTPKVLLIDDSEITAAVARIVLESGGFEVRVVHSLGEFNVAIKTWSPDVVLSDVQMPGITGAEICQWLKQSPETLCMRVVLFSDMPEADLKKLAEEAGADGYVSKQHGMEQVCSRLSEICVADSIRVSS